MRLLRFLGSLAMTAAFFLLPAQAAEETRPILVLEVTGTIDPAVARYVIRGLEQAQEEKASAVILELDTPGGLDGSMRRIVKGILNSPVPVVVYVWPSGGRAASAGVFITLAAHAAAMASGTNIGAAHPVHLGGDDQKPSAMGEKLTNDAVAYVRSIAQERGRNVEWAEKSVRESISSSAEEARQAKVIDFIAADLDDLVGQAHGRPVATVFGGTVLELKDQPRQTIPMTVMEQILHQLAHPNLAYLLLLLGIYGLIYELATPGATFPGVAGAILLVLGLVALETLEVNWAGLTLILLAVIFFIADIKLPGYGALTLGGIIAFLFGSMLLFPEARPPHLKLALATIWTAAGTTAAFFLIVVGAGLRALKRKVISGMEGLIGSVGVARTDLKPDGLVHLQGEEWQARAEQEAVVRKGMRVKVVKVEGLTLLVEPVLTQAKEEET